MPKLEIVSIAEVQKKTANRRSRVILEYVDLIKSVGPGQAGRLTPVEGETAQSIRRRLGVAASAAGIDLTIKKADGSVYFWAEKRRPGRPKKVTLDG